MKKIATAVFLFLAVLVLAGCNNSSEEQEIVYALNSVFKTVDGGTVWEKASADDSGKIVIVPEILSLEISPLNSQILYAGTEKDGLFFSVDGAASWKKIEFPLTRIYGLGIGSRDGNVIYASGLLKERGKIYKSLNAGKDWDEIYSEPSSGMVISALAVDPRNQDVVFAGNSDGMIIKTTNGGSSWKNMAKADGPITGIDFDSKDSQTAYFLEFNSNILKTRNGGEKMEDVLGSLEEVPVDGEPFFLLADPSKSGRVVAGMDGGIMRSDDFGAKFEALNIIESSKNFPIRSLAINPQNSNEIIYNSAQAIYKSIDGGEKWDTFQLDTARIVSQIKYDKTNPSIIYFGLRKVD